MGEDYSGHPALRPLASLGVALRAFNIAPGNIVEPLSVQILPWQLRFNIFATSKYSATNSFWWRGEDSNLRRWNQQIYSLPPLAAREPLLKTKPRILLEHYTTVNHDNLIRALNG
jgi:hypothetical protein